MFFQTSRGDVTIFYHVSARSMEQNWKRILVTWIVALFAWDVMQKHDIHMCYSKLHGIHTWFTSTQHPSFQPNIHSSTHRLPVSDCISEVRPQTARRLTRSNKRPTDVAREPRLELRWIQPLARLQALIPGEMTTTLVLVTPQKKTEIASANPHRTWESRPYNLKKKCIHWFICIHHHSSVIEATLNHSTVVASIHLTSSIPEMPAAHQETWCKSQPVKYHPKVGLFGGVCFFQGHDDSRGTQQKWPPPWTRIIAILLEWHRKYNSNCSAPLWLYTMILNTGFRQSFVQLQGLIWLL